MTIHQLSGYEWARHCLKLLNTYKGRSPHTGLQKDVRIALLFKKKLIMKYQNSNTTQGKERWDMMRVNIVSM